MPEALFVPDDEHMCPACNTPWAGGVSQIGEYDLMCCSSCGLWFYSEQVQCTVDYSEVYKTPEYQEAHFKSLQTVKDWKSFALMPTYRPFFENLAPSISKRTLLDVGCGVGRFCRAAYVKGWDVQGIDVSSTALDFGRVSVPFPMHQKTAEEMRHCSDDFDVVTCFEVLEHLNCPRELLDSIYRLTKPDGKFFCTVPNQSSLQVQTTTRRDWLPPIHVLFFTERALKALLVRAGFVNVKTGLVWVNEPPIFPSVARIFYEFRRLLGRIEVPEPLGIWALATRPGRAECESDS